jgi:putative chitinase
MITPAQLHTVFPLARNVGDWCRVFDKIVDEFELRPDNRLAMFLAQCGFESEQFNTLRERTSYRTPKVLMEVFPREFPTEASAMPYVLNPAGLANFVYANRNGNGDVATGDGFKYRGGGLIELTGRGNYKGVGVALGIDLEARPAQIEQPMIAARTAGFFWKQNDLNAAADAGDFDYCTRRINGPAMEGRKERTEFWLALKGLLGKPTPAELAVAARRSVPQTLDGVMTPGMNGAA